MQQQNTDRPCNLQGKGKHAPKNRSLPTDMLGSMISSKLGGGGGGGGIHEMLAQVW